MTAQVGDRLYLDGELHKLGTCPALPWHHPRLVTLSEEAIATRKPLSACWRRYVASWEIKDDRLHLAGIDGIYRLSGEEPLFADWITETLRVPQGRMLSYVHMGFGSIYEKDLFLKVTLGIVESRHVVANQAVSKEEAWRRGADHLPSIATVAPGRGGKKH